MQITPYTIEKGVALMCVVIAVQFLSPTGLLNLFIVLGQGHFVLAYIYQYAAGKIGLRYILIYIALLTSLLGFFLYTHQFEWLVVIAGTQFLIHFLQDEIYLFRGEHSLFTTLEGLMLAVLYFGMLYERMFFTDISFLTLTAVILAFIVYTLLAIRHAYRPIIPSRPVLVGIVALLALEFSGVYIPIEVLLGSLILFHYIEWYVHFYLRLQNNTPALRTYFIRVLYVNALIVGLYFIYVHVYGRSGVLQYLFLPFYFYIWTLMHTLTSIRFSDYVSALNIPRKWNQ